VQWQSHQNPIRRSFGPLDERIETGGKDAGHR
jgi:hypothetical protein